MVEVGGFSFGVDLLHRQAVGAVEVGGFAVVQQQRQGGAGIPGEVMGRGAAGLRGEQAGAVVGEGLVDRRDAAGGGAVDRGQVACADASDGRPWAAFRWASFALKSLGPFLLIGTPRKETPYSLDHPVAEINSEAGDIAKSLLRFNSKRSIGASRSTCKIFSVPRVLRLDLSRKYAHISSLESWSSGVQTRNVSASKIATMTAKSDSATLRGNSSGACVPWTKPNSAAE